MQQPYRLRESIKTHVPTGFQRGLVTGCVTLILVAVFLVVYGLGFWNGLYTAFNDPPPFEWYQRK